MNTKPILSFFYITTQKSNLIQLELPAKYQYYRLYFICIFERLKFYLIIYFTLICSKINKNYVNKYLKTYLP